VRSLNDFSIKQFESAIFIGKSKTVNDMKRSMNDRMRYMEDRMLEDKTGMMRYNLFSSESIGGKTTQFFQNLPYTLIGFQSSQNTGFNWIRIK